MPDSKLKETFLKFEDEIKWNEGETDQIRSLNKKQEDIQTERVKLLDNIKRESETEKLKHSGLNTNQSFQAKIKKKMEPL